MRLKEVLQMIDKLIAHHLKTIDEQLAHYDAFSSLVSTDYHEGAVDALEDLRDAIKQKGGEK